MNIEQVLTEYDAMFGVKQPDEIQAFLLARLQEADAEGDDSAQLTLWNEYTGFCRDRGKREEALNGCRQLKRLSTKMGIADTVPFATTMINMANAYRVFRCFDEAAELYPQIEQIYLRELPADAFEIAALYNNWALLFSDLGDPASSAAMLRKALSVIDRTPAFAIPQASTRVNLACTLRAMRASDPAQAEAYNEDAKRYLDEAVSRFRAADPNDYHYSAALSAMADIQMEEGAYAEAAETLTEAMRIMKMYMGENAKYRNLQKKREAALAAAEGEGR